ncbi:MAG TPA: hypothetical protein VG871_19765 [Vicinamibacterales bacterium]|nr:hypothetical protein [Vicinamibacterales bacterium]
MRPLAVLGMIVLAAGCGGSSGPTSQTSPSQVTQDSPSATPASADWTALATQMVGIGIDSFQTGLTFPQGATTTSAQRGAVSLLGAVSVPASPRTWSTGYFCCGASPTTGISVSGTLRPQGDGTATLDETITATGTLDWRATNNPTNWMLQLPAGGMRITCTLAANGGTIQPSQTFTLAGTMNSPAASGAPMTTNAQIGFADYQSQTGGTASGQIGPVSTQGTPVSPPISPSPCSLPDEGCEALGPPGPNGPAPCTPYPACPS